jgi:hypothetical protein
LKPFSLDDLLVRLAHQRLDGLGQHGPAIELLQVVHRHLAGTESVDVDAALQVVEPCVGPGGEIGHRHHHAEFALETFGQGGGHLHGLVSFVFVIGAAGRLVRAEGLEPPRLSPREPKSRVSTNSTTPAEGRSK